MTKEYTFSIALVDYLPVLFTAIGLTSIARMVLHVDARQGRLAFIGTVLTVSGGFFKATWKLILASSNGTMDITWMDNSLFVLMAPGYTLLAWSVWQTVQKVQGKKTCHVWYPPFVIIAVMFSTSILLFLTQPDTPAWERMLLSIMVLATIITGLFLIVFGFRQGLPVAGWLFVTNLVGVLILNGLARINVQTIALQWIEEGINTVSWLAFAIAATQIYGYTRIYFGVDPEKVKSIITA